MGTLVIYDDTGYVISQMRGVREPQGGVQFMWWEVPDGKIVARVDTTTIPHQVILENTPPTEIDLLRLEMAQSNTELFEMMLMMGGGA